MSEHAVIRRNHVHVTGAGERTLLLAHGFGCDQNMWRFVLPALAERYRVVTFDYVGSGNSELAAFDPARYGELDGYAADVLEICEALDLRDVAFVGHSVSAMIGLIASLQAPERFAELLMVCPSPDFQERPPEYHGGFHHEDLVELLDLMDKNYIGWANYLAPLVMGGQADEALVGELSGSFCSTDPIVAKTFARATFFSDCRHLLPRAEHPTLILQNRMDPLVPVAVGEYMHAAMPDSTLRVLGAEGHCPHMTHSNLVTAAVHEYLEGMVA